jgi:hypothetical protein
MRRPLALVVAGLLAASALTAGVLAGSSPATASGFVTGRLASIVDTDLFLSGATVSLRVSTGTGPGTVVDTDITDTDGRFSLDAGPAPEDEYYVEVTLNNYRHGFVSGAPDDHNYVELSADFAATYSPDASLGKVLIIPSFIRGILVNAATGRRVANVKVAARSDNDASQFEGSDVTNSRGVFKIRGIECEDDCYLKFAGNPEGYENGFRACPGTVVPTFDEACASPIGNIGRVRIDHL